MTCSILQPIFANPTYQKIKAISSQGDGTTICVSCNEAYSKNANYKVAYNIYYSKVIEDVFYEGPKYVTENLEAKLSAFNPMVRTFFAVRAMLWNPLEMDIKTLPSGQDIAPNCYTYPETYITKSISNTDTTINVFDAVDFPPYGLITLEKEVIMYYMVDKTTNTIHILPSGRGYNGTVAAAHNEKTVLKFFTGYEEKNDAVITTEADFHTPNYAYTEEDGYCQVNKDIINTDLTASDTSSALLKEYDYTGYHRTSTIDTFAGHCIGSYQGGEYGLWDGKKKRGLNLEESNYQRQQMLLDVTGEPVVLLRRRWTGIRCKCFRSNYEAADGRCPICLTTGFVGGYEQYFNTRRSDRRLMIRFDATNDDVAYKNRGFEENFLPNAWTVVSPAIKDRDMLIRFNRDGTEEYRYEILNVNRNRLLFSVEGAQKFQLHRCDKTDIIYQYRTIRDASKLPTILNTSVSNLVGHGPHLHNIVINENITMLTQVNQTTSVNFGHSHYIINGEVQEVLGHTHTIVLP